MSTELQDVPSSAAGTTRRARGIPWPVAALLGLVALLSALAAGHLVAGFIGLNASPFNAVGATAIDNTPLPVKNFAVETFGEYDKLVLKLGMGVVLVLLSLVAGVLSRRRASIGLAAIFVIGVVGIGAVYVRPDVGAIGVLAPVVSLVAGLAAFSLLHRLALAWAAERQFGSVVDSPSSAVAAIVTADDGARVDTLPDPDGPTGPPAAPARTESADPNRRRFLVGGLGVTGGALIAGVGGQLIGDSNNADSSRSAVGPLIPGNRVPAIPADADFAKLGTPPFITPNPAFYRVDTALVVPQVRAETWQLKVHGMVDREVSLSYSDVRSMPLVERVVTICCVSNPVGGPYISTAKWVGVDLPTLLDQAGVQPGAEQLYTTSADGWNCGTPVSAVLDPNRGAMLALGMNDEALPIERGFPARMLVPGLYGFVSGTKWITDMEFTRWSDRQSYWLKRGWSEQAPIKTESRIDTPKGFENVGGGKTTVSGIAWAQHTGVEKVEIRLDQGPWQPATLSSEYNLDTWRMWWVSLDTPAGVHQVTVRATDKSGYTQTQDRVDTVPDGATGWHTVTFTSV